MKMRTFIRVLLIACVTLGAGCASPGAKPWQRDVLSRSDMRPDGAGLDDAIDDHLSAQRLF